METNKFYRILQQMLHSMNERNLRSKKIFNVSELSKYTGFSVSQIYKLTSSRRIPHYRVSGKSLFFKRDEVDLWLTENPVPTRSVMLAQFNAPLKRVK